MLSLNEVVLTPIGAGLLLANGISGTGSFPIKLWKAYAAVLCGVKRRTIDSQLSKHPCVLLALVRENLCCLDVSFG